MPEGRVTIQDCRDAGFCVAGVRAGCASLGLDFRRLVREGLPLADLEPVDDLNLSRVVEVTKKRIERDG